MLNARLSGLALMVGSGGMIITMALHPTGGHVAVGQLMSLIPRQVAVHSLALACLPMMFIGTFGLSRRVGSELATGAMVLYAFGLVAVMNAAVLDGLVIPRVLRQIVASEGKPQMESWFMMSHFTFDMNQGYMQVFTVAASAAIILWSVSSWRVQRLARGLAIYGCLLGAVTGIALFSGHLSLDKHGAGLVVFGQATWFILAGGELWHRESGRNVAAA